MEQKICSLERKDSRRSGVSPLYSGSADPPQCVLLADQPDPLRALQGLSIGVLAKKGRS
jgi:hypothetical protein